MKNPFANLFKKKKKDEADKPPIPTGDKPKKEGFFDKFLKNRLGKQSIKGEEILGVELPTSEIRLSKQILNRFSIISLNSLPDGITFKLVICKIFEFAPE